MKIGKIGSYVIIGLISGGTVVTGMKVFEEESDTIVHHINEVHSNNAPIHQATYSNLLPNGVSDFTLAAENTVNSVVHVTTTYTNKYQSDPYMDLFWGPGGSRGSRPQIATGSGVIISNDGYIVTNNHVIDDADKIEVTLNNNEKYTAVLVGTDPSSDIALLKIEGKSLPAVSFANSDELRVGEWVLAVGNPFNLTSTVTAGIVSAKARDIDLLKFNATDDVFPLESFIQTDAAVNPGNSGGALVNSTGQLVGINTAIASRTGSYAGYSFAVPSTLVKKITDDLLEYGVVQRAFIGVALQKIDQEVADERKLPNTKGVLVVGLSQDGAAAVAGVKDGDVILKIGDLEVNSVPALQEQVGQFRPGDKVQISVRRDGALKTIPIVLRNKNGEEKVVKKEEIEGFTALGASFKRISAQEMKNLDIKSGVKVANVGPGKFRSAGVTEGVIITKVNRKDVGSPQEFVDYVNNFKGGILLEGMTNTGVKKYYGFGL